MTSDEVLALGRRAVACKGWRWMAGMSTTRLEVVVCVGDGAVCVVAPNRPTDGGRWTSGAIPDLRDPATLGCLLALVREAYHNQKIHTRPGGVILWLVRDPIAEAREEHRRARLGDGGATEAEALVAALEAAP